MSFTPLSASEISELLARVTRARIAVLGDYCLDAYWMIDLARSEPSLETGKGTHPVRSQRYLPGGAGNVIHNIVEIGCGELYALGVVGDDPWGREMIRVLDGKGVHTDDMLVQADGWSTLVYAKPHVEDEECNRIDFGNYNELSDRTAAALLARVRARLPDVDVVVVNEQVREGIHSEAFRRGLRQLIQDHPDTTFIVDSRHYSEFYIGAWLKVNDIEAARLCGREDAEGLVLRDEAVASARTLYERGNRPVFVTRGARGVVVCHDPGEAEVPGVQVMGRTDTVGAGDSMLAGISLALASGCDAATAAQFGNLVAAVTVQKIHQTGTASPEEIRDIAHAADYIYHPELAEDPRQANFLAASEIEVVHPLPEGFRLRHAIFDHDGTLSTLREGWDAVMETVMIESILGPCFDTADESLYHRVVTRVTEYIDASTGIQTLLQMQALADMVEEFGCVAPGDILDAHGYKEIFNRALMTRVRRRTDKLARGELSIDDFSPKNATAFIRTLHDAGVILYLASGTDVEDVRAEAEAMGYAHLFAGGIHGGVGDVSKEAKRIVLDRILDEVGPDAIRGLAAFGDGPVEIRETHKRGGVTVGIASDELRRFGLNAAKRTRLIKAGADLVIPDYSQMDRLLVLLGAGD